MKQKDYAIEVCHYHHLQRIIQLKIGENTIGSHQNNDIVLSFPSVSRVHGSIFLDNNGIVQYQDKGSTNGSAIAHNFSSGTFEGPQNYKKLIRTLDTGTELTPLIPGDAIVIHPYYIKLIALPDEKPDEFEGRIKSKVNKKALESSTLENFKKYSDQFKKEDMGSVKKLQKIQSILDETITQLWGSGPLEWALKDADISEVMINRYNEIFIEKKGKTYQLYDEFTDNHRYEQWVRHLVQSAGGHLSDANPIFEGSLPTGKRIAVLLKPLCAQSTVVCIRSACPQAQNFWQYDKYYEEIRNEVVKGHNILIAGATSSGKTTLLSLLATSIPEEERIVSIEDTSELKLSQKNYISLVARHSVKEHYQNINLDDLLRTSLRLRPDRIILGECRGKEVSTLIQALNTGHKGSLCTIHASSCTQAIDKLALLFMLSFPQMTQEQSLSWITNSFHCVVMLEKAQTGTRRIKEVLHLKPLL